MRVYEGQGEQGPAAPLRVVLADDHALYRSGLARQLRESGIEVVAEVPNGESAVRVVGESAPDVVLMDLRMPRVSGLEATRQLTKRGVETGVLVLTVSADEADVTEAILEGASGYVLKDEPLEQILQTIRTTAAGRPHISPRVAMALRRHVRDLAGEPRRLAGIHLSGRDLDVLNLLAEGYSVRDIARMRMVSTGAIEEHMSTTLLKLQVEHRLHLSGSG